MDQVATIEQHSTNMTSPHILVVDDDRYFVKLVSTWLERARYQVTPAYSGEQALDALGVATDTQLPKLQQPQASPFDLVVLDVMMPGVRGTEICRLIRADVSTAQIPVLVLTALTSSQERIKALEAGANDYITKPFRGVEFLARVNNLVSWHRAELEAQAEIRQRNRELNALNEVFSTLNQTLNLPDLLRQTLTTVCRVTGFPWSAIHLLGHTGHCLELAADKDVPRDFLDGRRHIPHDESLMWQVIEQMRSLATEPFVVSSTDRTVITYHCVLLVAKGQPVGLLTVGDAGRQALTAEETKLLGAIGHQIGISVANASLFEQLQQLYSREQQRVAELTTLTRELERSQAQLLQSEKMAAAGRLAASLAHEINNPLQAIHNCLILTQRFPLETEEHTDYLKLAGTEVERLIGVVQRTLEFFRPSRGHRTPTDINDLIRHVVALTQKKLQHSDVELQLNSAPNLPPAYVVPGQISQVLLNLIINAIEAMPDGGQLELASRSVGEWVEISVTDNGPGLSQEQIEQVFEPFFTTKSAGTGLGLAISFGIVERHGGTIQVTSSPNKGATFTVRLPTAPEDERTPQWTHGPNLPTS